jgi:hypothetical protein
MSKVTIELDSDQIGRLQELAASEQKTEEELCQEAVQHFLAAHALRQNGPTSDGYNSLSKMIGLVEDGPADASIQHDLRTGDEA